jgi:hypothetical protein
MLDKIGHWQPKWQPSKPTVADASQFQPMGTSVTVDMG